MSLSRNASCPQNGLLLALRLAAELARKQLSGRLAQPGVCPALPLATPAPLAALVYGSLRLPRLALASSLVVDVEPAEAPPRRHPRRIRHRPQRRQRLIRTKLHRTLARWHRIHPHRKPRRMARNRPIRRPYLLGSTAPSRTGQPVTCGQTRLARQPGQIFQLRPSEVPGVPSTIPWLPTNFSPG